MSRVDDKYLKLLRTRYRAAGKKEKSAILDEFVKTAGYGRKYAIWGSPEKVDTKISQDRV